MGKGDRRPKSGIAVMAAEGRDPPTAEPPEFDAAIGAWAMRSPVPACIYERDTLRVVQANAAARNSFSRAGAGIVGGNVTDLCAVCERDRLGAELAAQDGVWPAGAWPLIGADTAHRVAQVIARPTLFDGQPCVLMLVTEAAPATPNGTVQAQLDLRSEQFREACRLAKLRLWDLALPPGAAGSAGQPPREVDAGILDEAAELALGPLHPDDRDSVRNAMSRCLASKGALDIEFRTLGAGRRVAFWHAVGRCQIGQDRSPAGIAGVCQDVSDRREAELAVQQTEKWKSLGQLTGGIAHDFNNLLTVISTNLEMLAETIPDQHELLEFIEPARKAANSGADLTARLLAFAQRQPLRPELVRLGIFLPSLRDLAVRTIGGRYTIEVACPNDVSACLVDRAQLEGALLNLIVNARDAMPAGGRIVIEASNVRRSEAGRTEAGANPPRAGQFVSVSVADEGGGIAPDIIDRVFEPFFTTKAVGKGTGLGLSMVQGFAQQSGGHVVITSRPGQGTRVALHLPRATGDGSAAPARAVASEWRPLPFRTLVVDDSPDVLRAVTRMCHRVGLAPVPAATAEEALTLLRGPTGFDLLLTDVILPGRFGGADIAREARRLQPAIRILYTSGYTHADIVNHAKLDPTIELLLKPYTRQQLLAALRTVMTGTTPAVVG